MKKINVFFSGFVLLIFIIVLFEPSSQAQSRQNVRTERTMPFSLSQLHPVRTEVESGKTMTVYDPRSPYAVFINYELGMHCVGFDISYCCIIPPYNSIQAQAVKTGQGGTLPRLLSPDDDVSLNYFVRDNSYSEGNKMKYWSVPKDVSGSGSMDRPGDTMANYVWSHLFIYKDLDGTIPADWSVNNRLFVGKDIQIPIDAGPTGKSLAGGSLTYAGATGGNKVFTDSLIPDVKNIQLTLTGSYLWDALGLPLTAFNDSRRKGPLRTVSQRDFQPYQYSVVRISDSNGKPVVVDGKQVEFFGTNPVDLPNCYECHSREGVAATRSRMEGLSLFDKEYAYWKKNYPDTTEFIARLMESSINVLELHDKHHGTNFLQDYNSDTAFNRLGSAGPVNCPDCHGDNISGNLQSPRPTVTGYKPVKASPLTEAVHGAHAAFTPMPDKAGRTQSCQACHPMHWQMENMNDETNAYLMLDSDGKPRFTDSDARIAGGGCYLRRDAHTNPAATPPFFLNEIGKWYLREVSLKDENGNSVTTMRGLYCTNCHNQLSHELYRHDDLKDVVSQKGKTLRNKSIAKITEAVAQGSTITFKEYFADPVVGAKNDPLRIYYKGHTGATLVKASKDKANKLRLLAWNSKTGDPVPYDGASAGKDWWLSAAEPHCANCHIAPFVESEGGAYFPIDQPNKYSLYRYSKAHGTIACQSCHESIHGLYPVRYEGQNKTVDLTTHEQALQFSPDGAYAGPVTCSACHRVNSRGVPVELSGTKYYDDYWASVTLLHFMREGDEKLPVKKLIKKYPYRVSRKVVQDGWR